MQIKNKDAMDPASWCGLNRPDMSEKDVDAVIFGIPFEGGIAYRGGTSEAPDVLRANTKLATPCTEELAYYKDFTVLDVGNFAMAEGGDLVGQGREDLFKEVQDYVESLVREGTRFTMIGGDHSVTIPMLRGVDAALDDPEDTFGIVYIDAHMDLSYAMGGDLLSQGSVTARAHDLNHIAGPENIFYIGIRSIEEDEFEFKQDFAAKGTPLQIRTSRDCYLKGIETIAEECIETMKKYDKIYISMDIDGVDPGFAAGTGSPQGAGLSSRQELELIHRLFSALNVIGFDIVEISPPLDDSLASMFMGRMMLTNAWGEWADKIGKLVR